MDFYNMKERHMIFKEKCICSIPCSILKGGCKSAVKSIVCGLRSDSNPLTHVLKEGRNSLKNKGFGFFVRENRIPKTVPVCSDLRWNLTVPIRRLCHLL